MYLLLSELVPLVPYLPESVLITESSIPTGLEQRPEHTFLHRPRMFATLIETSQQRTQRRHHRPIDY